MKLVLLELNCGHLRVGDIDAAWIAASIDLGSDAQAGAAVRGADQTHNRGHVHERRPAPVHRDVREQLMLDAIPLAGARRKMTDHDRQSRPIGKSLQFPFPEAESHPIAAHRSKT